MATVLSALASGQANGVRLLSDAGRARALEPQSDRFDLMLRAPIRWGMGFALQFPLFDNPSGPRIAYWGGNVGSIGFVDFDARMALGFVMNPWIEGP